MPEHLHVHVPARQLEETLPFLLDRRLQPEVAFKGPDLDELRSPRLQAAGDRLATAGLGVTVHAPFHDLNPGALEPLVRDVTRHRLSQTLAAAEQIGARLVVVHPGYDTWKYGGQDHLWLEQSLAFWPPLIAAAKRAGIVLALENIFEVHPHLLSSLLEQIDSPFFSHCFDAGHWRLFANAVSLPEWFAALGRRTVHLHLHDNRGTGDDHLPIGDGDIDFSTLFRLVATLPASPSMTLEAHSRDALLRSLSALERHLD